jgi:outer membrane protein assembly factor BamA
MEVRKKIYSFIIIVNIFLYLSAAVTAQDTTAGNKPIKEIIIVGNKHTKGYVIRRELLVREGLVPTAEQLTVSQSRLENLYLFNRVELTLVPLDETYDVLVIDVTERLYFYPVPIFQINERDWSKISYGLALAHLNFRGKNERISAGIWLGYSPGFSLNYSNPWAADSLHLTTGFSATKYAYSHRTLDFHESHLANQVSIGKWWSYHFLTDIVLKFENIKVEQRYAPLMHSGKDRENQLGIQLGIRHDTRDRYYYPSSGWFNRFFLYENGLFQSYDRYHQLIFDTRYYQPLGSLILAVRAYQNYLLGEVPVYRLNYIGYEERIRGHFYTQQEGRNVNIGSMEIRFPLLPVTYHSYEVPPVPAVYLKNLKFGLSGSLFIDSGIIWDTGNQYSLAHFMTGFGTGLHIHLPYVEIVRFDYAFDLDFNGQFIFEIGVAY